MSDKKQLETYRKEKDELRKRFPGKQKIFALEEALQNIHKYDENIQFLVLFDMLEHKYNLEKARLYRSRTVEQKQQKIQSRNNLITKALNLEPKINQVPITITIDSTLVTPNPSEPPSPTDV